MMMVGVKNLNVKYNKKDILKGINFNIKNGDTLSILGANGSGKSTLLKAMLGFLKFSGEVLVFGKSVKDYSKKELANLVAYIPQNHVLPYDYSVYEVVLMGALCRTGLLCDYSKDDKNLALLNIEKMGIFHLKDKPYTKISGGERQLTYIARALTQKAKVIFMDEPTNGLDFGNQIKLLQMIELLSNQGQTIIQTTHYPKHAKFVSNKVLLLKNGEVFKFGKYDEVVNLESINELYNIKYENFKDKL